MSGEFEFTISVSDFHGRAGTRTFDLTILEDTIAPTVIRTTPRRFVDSVRNDSVVAVKFSEPMAPFTESDLPAIEWTYGTIGQTTEIEPNSISVHWNELGDTAYLVSSALLALGEHSIRLNAPSKATPTEELTLFRDASGNLLEPTNPQSFTVTHLLEMSQEEGTGLEQATAVEEIWLIREKIDGSDSRSSIVDQTNVIALVQTPPSAWNMVRHASVTNKRGESKDFRDLLSVDSSSTLHLSGSTIDGFENQSDWPFGSYEFLIDTLRDGRQTVSLSLRENEFPPITTVVNECEVEHIRANQSFRLEFEAEEEAERLLHSELVIGNQRFPALRNYPSGFGIVYQSTIEAGRTHFDIPAGTFQENQTYFAALRQYVITDESLEYPGVLARVAFASTTLVNFSTREPVLACPTLTTGTVSARGPANNGDFEFVNQGGALASLSELVTDSNMGAEIQFGRGSILTLSAETEGVLDASGSSSNVIQFNLVTGGVTASLHPDDEDQFQFRIISDAADVTASSGSFLVLHESTSQVTSLTVLDGEALLTVPGDSSTQSKIEEGMGLQLTVSRSNSSPALAIERDDAGSIILSWDANYAGCQLFSKQSLGSGAQWQAVNGEFLRVADQVSYTVAANQSASYFRLFEHLPVGD